LPGSYYLVPDACETLVPICLFHLRYENVILIVTIILITSDCLGHELLNVSLSAGGTVSNVTNYSDHRKLDNLFVIYTERLKFNF